MCFLHFLKYSKYIKYYNTISTCNYFLFADIEYCRVIIVETNDLNFISNRSLVRLIVNIPTFRGPTVSLIMHCMLKLWLFGGHDKFIFSLLFSRRIICIKNFINGDSQSACVSPVCYPLPNSWFRQSSSLLNRLFYIAFILFLFFSWGNMLFICKQSLPILETKETPYD